MSAVLQAAERVARAAHAGQVDQAGDPYLRHVERVVAAVDGEDAKVVAWLHDVIEDSHASVDALAAAGIPARLIDAVEVLSRVEGERYADYIDRLVASGNRLARVVKIADLVDHLGDHSENVDFRLSASMARRYQRALGELTRLGVINLT